jgi:hypothetical protein
MIGDDVGISSKEGARRYRTLLDQIGVSINDSKSLIPSDHSRVAEIAKRQFISGKEISPIPPRVLVEATKNLEGLLEFLQVTANRTGRFSELTELELKGIRRIVRKNKEFNTEKFQVLLTFSSTIQSIWRVFGPFGPHQRWGSLKVEHIFPSSSLSRRDRSLHRDSSGQHGEPEPNST